MNVVMVFVEVGLAVVARGTIACVVLDGVEDVDDVWRVVVVVISVLNVVAVEDTDDVDGVSVEVDCSVVSIVLVEVDVIGRLVVDDIVVVEDGTLLVGEVVVVSLQVVEVIVVKTRVVIGVSVENTRGVPAGLELESQGVDAAGRGVTTCIFFVECS